MKKRTLSILALSLGMLVVSSCSEDNKDNTKKADDSIKKGTVEAGDAVLEHEMSDDEDFVLPSAMRIADIFESAGLEYMPGITNPVENAESYSSKFSKMLNFGVYSADLAYCSLNGQAQEAKNYMGAVKSLAKSTGLGPIFENETLITRFNDNIANKDSIRPLLAEVHEKTATYMDDPSLKGVSAIHYSGAWLEAMYLGANDVRNRNNNDIAMILIEQMSLLQNIMKGLKKYPNASEEMASLLASLENIETSFNNFESIKKYDSEGGELSLTKDEINQFIDLITNARNNITKTA